MSLAIEPTFPGPAPMLCGFENLSPAEAPHFRAFVHGCSDVAYHWHHEMEILFVLRGSFRLVVDGQPCEMTRDDVMIINSDVPHNSTSISSDALICGLHLDVGHLERLGLPGFATRHYLCRAFLHGRSFMSRMAPLKALMARLALNQKGHPDEVLVRQTIVKLIACFVYRTIPYEEAADMAGHLRSESRNRILRIIGSLEKQDGGRSLNEVADTEGLTNSHLSRLFKRYLGIGYREYCQNHRLDAAASQLSSDGDTIRTVMERHGFGNPANFYNKFRDRFGCSPAEYRRGQRPRGIARKLESDAAVEAQKILATYAAEVGKAAEAAIGLNIPRNGHRLALNHTVQGEITLPPHSSSLPASTVRL